MKQYTKGVSGWDLFFGNGLDCEK